MSSSETVLSLSKLVACYCLFTTIASIVLNPLVVVICLKSKTLRSNSTFKLLVVSAINDILVCMSWNQETFANSVLNLYFSYKNLVYCRFISLFLQYTTFEIQTWLMVSISMDRLLSMTVNKWSKFYFSGYRPYIYSVILSLCMIALNVHELFTTGFIGEKYSYATITYYNKSYVYKYTYKEVKCYSTDPELKFDWYSFTNHFYNYFGFVVPTVLLVITNLMIIYKATRYSCIQKANAVVKSASDISKSRRKAQMTKMILITAFLYITLLLPGLTANVYLYNYISLLPSSNLILNLLNAIQFTYPSLSFFFLYFSNKQFANEVKSIILRKCLKKHTTQQTNVT